MVQTSPCVLIVDPDEYFSAALVAEAQDHGLRAVSCRNWWEAKPLIEGPAEIALLIVELAQPQGMPNGVSVALMARRRRGKLPVLFVSQDPELLTEVRPGTGSILPKSAGVQRLLQSAAELAGGAPDKSSPLLFSSPRVAMSPVARYRLDDQARFRAVNDSALVLWRKTREELLGRSLPDAFPQLTGHPKLHAHFDALSERRAYRGVITSAILHAPIDLHIVPERRGLSVNFSLAA